MDNNGERKTFVPFTKAERIEQLGEIDKNIVNLLESTAHAIESLGKKADRDGDTTESQPDAFKDSMNDFLQHLRTVNVGMKRQIWGLEEEHIIAPAKTDTGANIIKEDAGEVQSNGGRPGLLEPDGDGKIGGLDVGWLNSRSHKVEKDMEADLWDEATQCLEQLLQGTRLEDEKEKHP